MMGGDRIERQPEANVPEELGIQQKRQDSQVFFDCPYIHTHLLRAAERGRSFMKLTRALQAIFTVLNWGSLARLLKLERRQR